MRYYPAPLEKLINELRKLPGIGTKTAQRLAFFMLKMSEGDIKKLARSIVNMKSQLIHCEICGNITTESPCQICRSPKRDQSVICVVEEVDDLLAFERTRQYKGVYHVLMGALSPLEGINPQDLRIDEFFKRLDSGDISEIILAMNHTTEGRATELYLAKRLEKSEVKVTELAYGLPAGGDIEYADEVTITKALEGRREIRTNEKG